MKKRNLPKNGKANRVQRQRDPIPWRYCLLTIVCGIILAAGFFLAARQHFSAIEYGIKNAKLRRQRDDLENTQRQLYLAKEIALSPVEIKKAAKKIGFQENAASGMEMMRHKVETVSSAVVKVADQNLPQSFLPKSATVGEQRPKSDKDSKGNKDKEGNKDKDSKENKENKPKTMTVADNIRPRVVGK